MPVETFFESPFADKRLNDSDIILISFNGIRDQSIVCREQI